MGPPPSPSAWGGRPSRRSWRASSRQVVGNHPVWTRTSGPRGVSNVTASGPAHEVAPPHVADDSPSAAAGLRTRGRSALAWVLAVFACTQFALAVVVERWRPELRDPEH